MGRPKLKRKTLKVRDLKRAIAISGGSKELAAKLHRTLRSLQLYKKAGKAPADIVLQIECYAACDKTING